MATSTAAGSVVVQADGGSRGNPGPAGYGAVVLDPVSGTVLAERWGFLGRRTNNVAEYSGVIAGLRAAAELGARNVAVRLDSKLIVQQMNGDWKVKHPDIVPLARRVAELVRGFGAAGAVTFEWIPRERNRLADALANRAMDEGGAGRLAAEVPGEPGAGRDTVGSGAGSTGAHPAGARSAGGHVGVGAHTPSTPTPGSPVAAAQDAGAPDLRAFTAAPSPADRPSATAPSPADRPSATATSPPGTASTTASTVDPSLLEELGSSPRPGATRTRPPGDPGSPSASTSTGSRSDPAAGVPLPRTDGATRIVIVRHGETTWGSESRFAGREDVPLTPRGQAEADSVGERVARIGPAVVVTSPLQRCRVTAETIGAVSGVPVLAVEGLTDGALGEWTGCTAAQIAERWPEEFSVWRNDPDSRPPGGESFSDVRVRVVPVVSDLVRRYRGHTVVVVTHAAVTKMVLVHALGVPTAAAYRFRIDTASVSGLTVEQDGRTVVWAVNEVGHLPE